MSHTLNKKIRNIRPERDKLTTAQMLVICRMSDYANEETMELYPYQDTLASELGLSRGTVNKCISKMKALGLIHVLVCRKHINQSTIYRFDPNCAFLTNCEKLTTAEKEAHKNRKGKTQEPPRAPAEPTKEEPEESKDVAASKSDKDAFKAIYAAYPKKKNKGKAEEVWNELEDKPDSDVILQAIEAYAQCTNWTKENGRYVPMLQKFLINEEWRTPPKLPKQAKVGRKKNVWEQFTWKVQTPSEEAMEAKWRIYNSRAIWGKESEEAVRKDMGWNNETDKLTTPEQDGHRIVNRRDVASYRISELGEDKDKVLQSMDHNEATDTFPKAKEIKVWDQSEDSDALVQVPEPTKEKPFWYGWTDSNGSKLLTAPKKNTIIRNPKTGEMMEC